MQTLTFLNSSLLWALGLASIPLIIHLLFRRRYKQIDWAPMKYLKLTIQRNRKRIQLEQLLLLLLRTAMIALLALLVARPVMHARGLGAWLAAGSRSGQLVLLDDSLSMGLVSQGKSALDRAKDLTLEILRDVGPKDRFTLAVTSQPNTPILSEVEIDDPAQVSTWIRDITPSETLNAWLPTLEAVDEWLTTGTYPIREVTIVTDLRKSGWDASLSKVTQRWNTSQVRVRIFDIGVEADHNLALADFRQQDRLALVGSPVHFIAEVRNPGASDTPGLDANWLVDGKPTLVKTPSIPANSTAQVPLLASFAESGPHHVSFQLPDDDLPGDNQRWLTVQVTENVHILVVDGEPSSEAFMGEVDFLCLAMSLGVGEGEAFQIEVATDHDWAASLRPELDLVVLANVANVTPPQAERLTKLVQDGMGLFVFSGEQIDLDQYNQTLYRDGNGLLPASLESIADEDVNGIVVESDQRSPLSALLQLKPAVLERVRTHRFTQLRLPAMPMEGVHVLARWNDPSSSPAVLEKVVGQGKVLFWTVPADKAWGDWCTEPSYILAVREAAAAIAKSNSAQQNFTAGQTLRRVLPTGHEVNHAQCDVPFGKSSVTLQVETKEAETKTVAARTHTLALRDTRRAGLYHFTWQETPGGVGSEEFGVNPDSRESDLERLSADEVRKRFAPVAPEIISSGAEDEPLSSRGQEIWRKLALGVLGMVVLEACFATWAGRQR
jgi:hypothetical protein